MLNRVDVLCIGLACWDLNFHTERLPGADEKSSAHRLISEGGGPAANAVASLSVGQFGGRTSCPKPFNLPSLGLLEAVPD